MTTLAAICRPDVGKVGARAESPLSLLREYLGALRPLLHGERVTANGRYVRLDGVALGWPPAPPPAVFAAEKVRPLVRSDPV